ncbi:MAG: sigma-70 family RNA polymerase sigma factor [Deltaproteobacteria bacterium]|nr:MAG: sigma-70 family RNA polymerase sigma factor [Deltaproteobacteria bacterium]
MNNPTDEELVRATRAGDGAAFDALYRRYSGKLFSYLLRLTGDRAAAEDLLQDVFLAVLRDRGFDLRDAGFGAWLFTVARRQALNAARGDLRRDRRDRAVTPADLAPAPTPEAAVAQRELVLSGLAALPEAHRDALVLKEVAGLTYREIARVQDVPEGTAKSRLHHAIRSLRALLRPEEETAP